MAASKLKHSLKKKPSSELGVIISSLKEANATYKKILAEMPRIYDEHNKLYADHNRLYADHNKLYDEHNKLHDEHIQFVKRFLSYETPRLEIHPQLTATGEKVALLSDELCTKEGNSMDDETSEKPAPVIDGFVSKLQSQQNNALKTSRQWLDYDQQREARERAVEARILALEKKLREVTPIHSQQHNEYHSDDVRLSLMQDFYEKLLKKAETKYDILYEHVVDIRQRLNMAQSWCWEKDRELDELKQQLQSEGMSEERSEDEHFTSEDEEQPARDETNEPQESCHAGEEVHVLKRQIETSSQALMDERQNSSYLKNQLVRILKVPSKAKQSKQESEELHDPPTQPPRDSPASSDHSSLLECPSCQAEYSPSQYRELLNHLDNCTD